MSPRWRFWACSALSVFALAGCTHTASIPVGGGPAAQTESAQTETAPPQARAAERAPAVEILSWDQTQKRREAFKGKVVVLDIWSTYCDPCVREFPNLVALQKRFGDSVVCISFDTDYSGSKKEPPESFRQLVLKFLSAQKADLVNVISSDPSEALYDRIHLGGPPAVFVYDRKGMLARRFDNSRTPKVPEFTYKNDVVPLVEKLLAGQKSPDAS